MALRELALLLTAKNMASGPIRKLTGDVSTLGRIAGRSGSGLGALGSSVTKLGVAAGAFLGSQVALGIRSLADLERVTKATEAVIASTGGKAGVTASQVRSLATETEKLTTVDDKTAQAGANLLLTFTGIGADVFPRATKAMVNMALAMNNGNVEGLDLSKTAIQIGKALNDPIKGAASLRRVGVMLTDQQQKQIAAFMKAGKVAKAQGIILAELETEFGKAGKAAGEGFGGDMRRFGDAVEGAQMALARGLIPVIREAARWLTETLGNPTNMTAIENAGKGLASGLQSALEGARALPWGAISRAASDAVGFARNIVGVFAAMPPWVQTAVVTGWGLNKVTGGAVGGILGDVAKGVASSFIRGVLGIQAGVVNVNAAVVNGGGGVASGLAGAAAGGAGKGILGRIAGSRLGRLGIGLGRVAGLGIGSELLLGADASPGGFLANVGGGAAAGFGIAGPLGAVAGAGIGGVKGTAQIVGAGVQEQAAGIRTKTEAGLAGKSLADLRTSLAATETGIRDISGAFLGLGGIVGGGAIEELRKQADSLRSEIGVRQAASAQARERAAATRDALPPRLDPRVTAEQAALGKFAASTAPSMKSMESHLATLRSLQQSTPARETANTQAIVAAISALSSRIAGLAPTVNVAVTAAAVSTATTSWSRAGRGRRTAVAW